jgi:hypothetical protein
MKKMDIDECQHTKNIKAFLHKYPTADKHEHFTINLVDPQE